MNKETTYIVVRDNFWLGVLGDVIMYGILLGLYWFNYTHLGNNGVLNIIFTVLVVVFIINLLSAKVRHTFYSYDEALEYLQTKGKQS